MENEEWVRMRNIPKKFLYKRSHCPGNEKEKALAAKQSAIPTSGEKPLFIIKFL